MGVPDVIDRHVVRVAEVHSGRPLGGSSRPPQVAGDLLVLDRPIGLHDFLLAGRRMDFAHCLVAHLAGRHQVVDTVEALEVHSGHQVLLLLLQDHDQDVQLVATRPFVVVTWDTTVAIIINITLTTIVAAAGPSGCAPTWSIITI